MDDPSTNLRTDDTFIFINLSTANYPVAFWKAFEEGFSSVNILLIADRWYSRHIIKKSNQKDFENKNKLPPACPSFFENRGRKTKYLFCAALWLQHRSSYLVTNRQGVRVRKYLPGKVKCSCGQGVAMFLFRERRTGQCKVHRDSRTNIRTIYSTFIAFQPM